MERIAKVRYVIGIILVTIPAVLSACTLSVGGIFIGLSGACDREALVVTKFEDADDGICTEDDCSLREAVITSNTCAGLQDIELPPGTYTLSIVGRGEDGAHTGDLDITDKVNLVGRDGEAVIDAGGIDRVFHIIELPETDGPHITLLKNLTITGGMADNIGGGIYVQDAMIFADSVNLRGNQAGSEDGVGGAGGGFYVRNGRINPDRVVIENNLAHGPGGGGYLENSATLVNGVQIIRDNRSLGGRGGGGLYISTGSLANIFDTEFVDNEAAGSGGGLWNAGTVERMWTTEYSGNVSEVNGGGFYNAPDGEAYLDETWFTNNNAQQGGGIFNEGMIEIKKSGLNNNTAFAGLGGGMFNEGSAARVMMVNATISGNMIPSEHEGGGGGIVNNNGDLEIAYSTLAYNSLNGLYHRGGSVRLANTILGHHGGDNCVGNPVVSGGYNLEDSSSCRFTGSTDMEVDRVGIDRLAMNGGFSLSHALREDSPALNSADPGDCPGVDQRGATRPMGERCDRGAFESKEYSDRGSDTMGVTAGPTDTPAPTPTVTGTPTPTVSPTPQEEPEGRLDRNAFCRTGPGTVYPPATAYGTGTTLVIDGQNTFQPKWWRVVVPTTGGNCWISGSLLTTTGPVNDVPEIKAPPTPTPTPVPPTVTPTYQGQNPTPDPTQQGN